MCRSEPASISGLAGIGYGPLSDSLAYWKRTRCVAWPPMGLRIRLKASFDVSTLPRPARVIAIALQRYGMILADNGSSGYISGFSNPLFNDDALHQLNRIKGQDLEVVDTSTLRNG